jgi:hypothetical protein
LKNNDKHNQITTSNENTKTSTKETTTAATI